MARAKNSSTGPGRIGPLGPVLGALVICGALVFYVTSTARDDDSSATTSTTSSTAPATTTTTEPPPDSVPAETIAVEPFAETPPDSYRVVYDVVENGLERTETITVRRPFESLVLSTRGDDVLTGTATSRRHLWNYLDERDSWLVIQPELHRAAFDHRPLAAMATMIALGLAEEGGTGSYLGRDCRIFHTGGPLSDPGATAPSESQSTEVCIDGNGLVLHERWEIGGQVVSERTATEIELDIDVADEVFDPTPVIDDAEEFQAILTSIAVPADDETLAQLETDIVPPDGFELAGAVLRSGSPGSGGSSVTEIVRFYTDGTDLIEVAEVSSPAGAELDGGGAVPVEIDGPETWFFPDFRASAVRTRLSDTTFVEIRGTNPAQLIELLDTLTRR